MKLKIKTREDEQMKCMISGVSWTMNNEVYYTADNKAVFKVNQEKEMKKFMEFEEFPTDLDWLPISKGINEVFAISFSDGSFQLITKLA